MSRNVLVSSDIPRLVVYPEVLGQVCGQARGRRRATDGLEVEVVGIRPLQLLTDIKGS